MEGTDGTTVYEQVGGREFFTALVERFYDAVIHAESATVHDALRIHRAASARA